MLKFVILYFNLLHLFSSVYSTGSHEEVYFPAHRLWEVEESQGHKVRPSSKETDKPAEVQAYEVQVPRCPHHATQLFRGNGKGELEN